MHRLSSHPWDCRDQRFKKTELRYALTLQQGEAIDRLLRDEKSYCSDQALPMPPLSSNARPSWPPPRRPSHELEYTDPYVSIYGPHRCGSVPRPMATQRLVLIAAHATNLTIGKDGGLPWRISEDWNRFLRLSRAPSTNRCIMGR